MTTRGEHISVLPVESVEALNIMHNGFYIDATFGRGGHSGRILERLGEDGRLLAFDCDDQAVAHAQELYGDDPRFSIVKSNYSEMTQAVTEHAAMQSVDGVLFDLGVSSPQLDQAARGFSFDKSGPLDMRMDQSAGQPVSEWLPTVSADELAEIFRDYGECRKNPSPILLNSQR